VTTPLQQVRRTRAALVAITVAQAALWALAAELLTHAALVSSVGPSAIEVPLVVAVGLIVAAGIVWRGRAAWSLERSALWVEARAPELEYALVTAIDPRAAHVVPELTRVIERVDVGRLVRRAALRDAAWAVAAVVIGVALAAVAPARGRTSDGRRGAHGPAAIPARSRLVPLTARVIEPAYAGRPVRAVREPATIEALVGSAIELAGRGAGDGLRAVVGADSVAIATSADGWSARLVMPGKSSAVRLRDRGYERVVGLDPVTDEPPAVTLTQPSRDSTLRSASGALELDALASDDIGLRDGHFEVIISSGDQEGSFRSAERRIGGVAFADARRAPMHARLDLAALGLTPGGLLSIRAVARDGNTVTGPGVGASETRTFRLAKSEEYDSVAVEGAPPPTLDSAYLSQRMVVLQTRALMARASRMPRDTVVHRSKSLGDKEEQLRGEVQSLLHGPGDEDEGGGGPVLLPEWQHALFDTAYQALADAAGKLNVADTRAALGPELVALRVLDRARVAKRIYLRGAPPTIVVNTERVRLTGTEKAHATPRPPGPARDTAAMTAIAAVARLEAIARLADSAPAAAADSVTLLRADVVGTWPAAGAALGESAAALRAHRDASAALARARRAIVGPARVDAAPPRAWDGGSE
jgi:hypothetical protein